MAEIEIPDPHEVKEKAENPFTRQIALFVAVYAVGLAVASFGGHNAAKEMMMAKQEEANQWNRYQSKSPREALYRNEIWKLEEEEKAGPLPPFKAALLKKYRDEERRMKEDKKEIEEGDKGARHHQQVVALMQRKDPYFDFAEVGFQLAIVMASVAMLAEKKWAFWASVAIGVASLLLTVNGFFLLAAVPGFEDAAH